FHRRLLIELRAGNHAFTQSSREFLPFASAERLALPHTSARLRLPDSHYAEKAWLLKERGIGRLRASGSNSPQMNDRFNEHEIKSNEKIMSANITKKLAGKVALVTGGSRS